MRSNHLAKGRSPRPSGQGARSIGSTVAGPSTAAVAFMIQSWRAVHHSFTLLLELSYFNMCARSLAYGQPFDGLVTIHLPVDHIPEVSNGVQVWRLGWPHVWSRPGDLAVRHGALYCFKKSPKTLLKLIISQRCLNFFQSFIKIKK